MTCLAATHADFVCDEEDVMFVAESAYSGGIGDFELLESKQGRVYKRWVLELWCVAQSVRLRPNSVRGKGRVNGQGSKTYGKWPRKHSITTAAMRE